MFVRTVPLRKRGGKKMKNRILDIKIGKYNLRTFSIAWWIVLGGAVAAGYMWCLGMCVLLV